MTTLFGANDALNRQSIHVGWDSHNLLDRFWDAVFVPSSEPLNIRDSFCSFEDITYEAALLQTPEIFAKTGSNPVINVKSVKSPTLNPSDDDNGVFDSTFASHPGSLLPTVWHPAHQLVGHERTRLELAPQITLVPATPSMTYDPVPSAKKGIRKPRLAIPSFNYRSGSGISSPGSALLAMASNFLGILVKLGKSPLSTPAPPLHGGGISIIDSEVLISVLDDEDFRGRPVARSCGQDDDGPGWLDSAPFPSTQTPVSAHRKAWSAQDMDQLAKMSWERQLMNVQSTLWH